MKIQAPQNYREVEGHVQKSQLRGAEASVGTGTHPPSTDGQCEQTDGNYEEESKGNDRNQKHRSRDGPIKGLQVTKERTSEFEEISTKISKIELQRGKRE